MNEPVTQFSLEEFLIHEVNRAVYGFLDLTNDKDRIALAEHIANAIRQNWVKLRI